MNRQDTSFSVKNAQIPEAPKTKNPPESQNLSKSQELPESQNLSKSQELPESQNLSKSQELPEAPVQVRFPGLRQFLYCLPLIVMLIAFDLITKKIAAGALAAGRRIPLIDGVLEFTFVQNRGAAFGILQNALPFFVVITLTALTVISYILLRIPAGRRFTAMRLCLCMIAAGALGNFIDRLTLSYVRDFIYFSLIDFPVFNVADIYITCATTLMVFLALFYYKEEDFAFLKT